MYAETISGLNARIDKQNAVIRKLLARISEMEKKWSEKEDKEFTSMCNERDFMDAEIK